MIVKSSPTSVASPTLYPSLPPATRRAYPRSPSGDIHCNQLGARCVVMLRSQSEHEVGEIFKLNLNSVWKCTGVCAAAAPQPQPDTFLLWFVWTEIVTKPGRSIQLDRAARAPLPRVPPSPPRATCSVSARDTCYHCVDVRGAVTRVAAVTRQSHNNQRYGHVMCYGHLMAEDKSHFVFIQTDLFTRSTVRNDNLGN